MEVHAADLVHQRQGGYNPFTKKMLVKVIRDVLKRLRDKVPGSGWTSSHNSLCSPNYSSMACVPIVLINVLEISRREKNWNESLKSSDAVEAKFYSTVVSAQNTNSNSKQEESRNKFVGSFWPT